ncbi:MAG: EamA family transporter RarD [Steroidobacteraceae bacterium]
MSNREASSGAWSAVLAFVIWGLFPLYWTWFTAIPGLQLLAHRMVWCALAAWGWLLLRRDLGWLAVLTPRKLMLLSISALLISVNWGIYVVAVTSGHVVDTSLGYFVTPLANIVLAVVVLRERLNGPQIAAVLIAAAGVTWLAFALGAPPWVSLMLAASFALYGLMRKLVPFPAVPGLAIESAVVLPPAVAYLLWCEHVGTGRFLHGHVLSDVMLVVGGPITALPLALFAHGAQRVPLTLLGVLQYIAPSVTLLIGVAWLHEPFGPARQVAFGAIWVALAIFTADGIWRYRRARSRAMG